MMVEESFAVEGCFKAVIKNRLGKATELATLLRQQNRILDYSSYIPLANLSDT